MSASISKRRRGEDEVRRPKKKIKIRKQTTYHSSSEDEEGGIPLKTASIATPQKALSGPKSILKARVPASHLQQHAPANEPLLDSDEHPDIDELEKNTAVNALREGDSGDENDEIESAEDGQLQRQDGTSEDEEEDGSEDSEVDSLPDSEAASSMTSSAASKTGKKRNDPTAFATSISKILGTKLSQPKREDPILSRSKDFSAATKSLAESKLEQKARALVRAEKKQALENGRVKDVLGLETATVDTGALLEQEKRLKKTAQRGVVRLFNAVRAAQVKAEEGMKQTREEGVVGMQKREERVNEMSKQGFLDLISQGGKTQA